MEVIRLPLAEVVLLQPRIFADVRGYFLETFQLQRFDAHELPSVFVQDNLSFSKQGVLRGLHFQNPGAQGKLVFPITGRILDVAVDVRVGSPTFGRHLVQPLDASRHQALWIPEGFAHGFLVESETAHVMYKCTTPYRPDSEHTLLWSDPDLGIAWGCPDPIVSPKDGQGLRLRDFPEGRLPRFRTGHSSQAELRGDSPGTLGAPHAGRTP